MELFFFIVSLLLVTDCYFVQCQDDIIMNNLNAPTKVELPKKNEDIEKAIKEKCIKAKGEGAFRDLEESKEKFKICLKSIVDLETLQEDIEQLQGDLELILSSPQLYNSSALYCRHAPEILDCLEQFTEKWEVCLFEEEKESFTLIANLTETLVDFLCEEEGERIQAFIDDGGIKCLLDRKERLQDCFNKSVKNMWLSDVSIDDIHLLSEDEDCKKFENFQNCIVKQFDTCKENSSFNFVEDLFNEIRVSLPCEKNSQEILSPETENATETHEVSTERLLRRQQRDKQSKPLEKCNKNVLNIHVGQELVSDSYQYFLHTLIEDIPFANCTDRIKHLEAISKDLIMNFYLCIPEYQYLPKLAERSITSMFNYINKDGGKEFCEFQASFAIMCFLHKEGMEYSRCLDETKDYPVRDGEVIYERTMLCGNAKIFKTCTQDFLDRVCEDINISPQKEFLHGLLDEFYSPCSGNLIFSRGALLILPLIIFYAQKLIEI